MNRGGPNGADRAKNRKRMAKGGMIEMRTEVGWGEGNDNRCGTASQGGGRRSIYVLPQGEIVNTARASSEQGYSAARVIATASCDTEIVGTA